MQSLLPSVQQEQQLTPAHNRLTQAARLEELLPAARTSQLGLSRADDWLQPVEPEFRTLAPDDLMTRLKSGLTYLRRPPGFLTTRREMHRRFDQSNAELQSMYQQIQQFHDLQITASAVLVNFEHTGFAFGVRQKTLQVMRDLIGELGRFSIEPPPPPLNLQVVGQCDRFATDTVYRTFLEDSIENLGTSMIAHFDRLQERGLYGRARFVGPRRDRHCQFTTFFSRAICSNVDHGQTLDVYGDLNGGSRTTEAKEKLSGTTKFQHVFAAYQLGEVRCVPLSRWRKPVPVRIRDLMRSVPAFLRQDTIVVDGVQRLGVEIACDVKDLDWSYEREETQTISIARPDPFLAIGPYVVGYWTDSDPVVGIGADG